MNSDQATKDQLYDQALTLFGNNQLDEAVVAFQEMICIFPDDIEGYMGLAHACERAEKYDGESKPSNRQLNSIPTTVWPIVVCPLSISGKA